MAGDDALLLAFLVVVGMAVAYVLGRVLRWLAETLLDVDFDNDTTDDIL